MKKLNLTITILLITLITASTVSAMENNGLYSTKEDAKDALNAARNSGSCTSNSCIFEELKKAHPDKKVDLWKCGSGSAVSVYYTDSSAKGYKAIYQDGSTQNSFLTCKDNGEIKESYKPDEKSDNRESSKSSESNWWDKKSSDSNSYSENSRNNEKSYSNDDRMTISDTAREALKEQIKEEVISEIKGRRSISLSEIEDILDKCIPDGIMMK
jgi:hypothetical protein